MTLIPAPIVLPLPTAVPVTSHCHTAAQWEHVDTDEKVRVRLARSLSDRMDGAITTEQTRWGTTRVLVGGTLVFSAKRWRGSYREDSSDPGYWAIEGEPGQYTYAELMAEAVRRGTGVEPDAR